MRMKQISSISLALWATLLLTLLTLLSLSGRSPVSSLWSDSSASLNRGARSAAFCTQRNRQKAGHIERGYNDTDTGRIARLADLENLVRSTYSQIFTEFPGKRTRWSSVVQQSAAAESVYTCVWKSTSDLNSEQGVSAFAFAERKARMYLRVDNPNMEPLVFSQDGMSVVGGSYAEHAPRLISKPEGASYPIDRAGSVDEPPLLVIEDAFFDGEGYVLAPVSFESEKKLISVEPYSVGGGVKENQDWPGDSRMGCIALAESAHQNALEECKKWQDGVQIWSCSAKPPHEVVLVLTQHHCTTYYHSFTELMTRFLAFYETYASDDRVKIAYTDSFVSDQFFDMLGVPDHRRIHLAPGEWAHAKILLGPPPVRQTEKRTRIYGSGPDLATASLLRAVHLKEDDRPPRPYILFMSRSKSNNGNQGCEGARCIANEPAVLEALRNAFGDKYDVRVFAHSDGLPAAIKEFGFTPRYVIGMHGAGWQNLAFCKSKVQRGGSPLYAIHMSSDFRRDFYKGLAEAVGARWARYFVPDVHHYSTNHFIDADALVSFVKEIEDGVFNYSLAAHELRRAAYYAPKKGGPSRTITEATRK